MMKSIMWTVTASKFIARQSQKSLVVSCSTPAILSSLSLVQNNILQWQQQQSCYNYHSRTFSSSNATKKQTAKGDNKEKELSYWEEKKAKKDFRRELYEKRLERKERVKVRRVGKPKDVKKQEFRNFFINKKVNDEYMNRKARQAGLDWKINVSVILERINTVLPDKEQWEIDYDNLRSYLDLFGKEYPKEFDSNINPDDVPISDDELLELLPFTPAPRETEDDVNGNVKTTNRKLKTSIYLMVKDMNDKWQMPTVEVSDNETLLEAGKRAMKEQLGNNSIEYWCPSNAPWSVDMISYTKDKQNEYYGIKTFYMKFQYDDGQINENELSKKNIQDYAWLDRYEITDRMKQEQGDIMSKFYYYML